MADIGTRPAIGQKPWDLWPAISAVNTESTDTAATLSTGRLSPEGVNAAIKSIAVSKGEYVTNVKDYGAKGDGTTNDTAAIRSAYGATAEGGTLYFPRGIYRLKADGVYGPCLNVTKQIQVTGEIGSLLKLADDAPVGSRMIQVSSSVSGVTVSNLKFHSNGIQSATCVFATQTSFLSVQDCQFAQPGSGALLVNDNVTDTLFTRNRVYGSGGYGILVNDNPGNARLVIDSNNFNGQNGIGDAVEINGIAQVQKQVITTNNTIANYAAGGPATGFGIGYANVSGGVIKGNTITNCGRNGIHVECLSTGVSVEGNYVENCQHAGIEVQGEVSKVCNFISITNNTVVNCCITPSINLGRGGIEVGSSTGAAFTGAGARGVIVSHNTLIANRGAGIYLFQSTDSTVTGNTVSNTYGVSTDTANAVQNVALHVISCTNSLVSNNRIFDTQSTPTQYYPILFYGSATGIMSLSNHTAGNLGGIRDMTTGVSGIINSTTGSLRFDGGAGRLGFFGNTPIVKPTGTPAAATDAATTQSLVNDLRSKLINLGIVGS